MDNVKLTKAILQLVPNAEFVLSGTDIDNITWLDSRSKPSKSAIEETANNLLPDPEPTIQEKLASVGLSVADLKEALGL
jgi:hypothetical protein